MIYYILVGRERCGPFSEEEINEKIKSEEIKIESLCWKKGMDDWKPIKEILGPMTEDPGSIPKEPNIDNNNETKLEEKSIDDLTEPESPDFTDDAPLYELIMGKFRFLFAVFSVVAVLLVGLLLMTLGKFFWGLVVTTLIGYLVYQTKGKIFKRTPRLQIFSDRVEFISPFSKVQVPWQDIRKISHYDAELADHNSAGLEFFLKNESHYLSQYSSIGRLLMKLSGKVTVFLSRHGSSSPFKIDFSGIGKEDEIEKALEICEPFLVENKATTDESLEHDTDEELNISWVGWCFYGLATIDFLASWIGILITPYEWSPFVFGALGIAFDRFIYDRENFPKLYKQIAGGLSLLLAFLFCLLIQSPDTEDSGDQSFFSSIMEDDYVTEVKSCVFESIDDSITLGNAFDNYKFFKTTTWESFEDDQGRRVVEFVGEFDMKKFLFVQNLKAMMEGLTEKQFEEITGEKYNANNQQHVKFLKSGGLAKRYNDKQIEVIRERGIPNISIHYKAQLIPSIVDDSVSRGYEGLILESHDEGLQVKKEYSNEAIFEFIFSNQEFLAMKDIQSIFMTTAINPLRQK